MFPGLADSPLIQHDDTIGILDGKQAVCDDQRSSSTHQFVERRLNVTFGFSVESRGCFIKNQDRRILEDGTCDGQPLALTAGKLDPVAIISFNVRFS